MSLALPYLDLVDDNLFVSSSFLETYSGCSRAGQYYKLDKRISSKDAPALVFGTHIHSALEMRYRLAEYGLDHATAFENVYKLLVQEFEREPNPVDGDWRTCSWAIELYTRYCEKFNFESYQVMQYPEPVPCKNCAADTTKPCLWCMDTRKTSIMTEVPFAYKLDNIHFQGRSISVYHHGFIDLPIYFNNGVFSRDFKTTSMLGDNYFFGMRMSGQHKGYANALSKTINQPVHGYVVTAIRTKEPPQYVTKGVEFAKIDKWWSECLAEEVFYSDPSEGPEWEQDTMSLVARFLWEYERGYFPKTMDHNRCVKYNKCSYYDVCSIYPAKDRRLMLYSGTYKNKEKTVVEI